MRQLFQHSVFMITLTGALQIAAPALALAEASAELVPLNRIVAVVNDQVLTQNELKNELFAVGQQLKQQGIRAPAASILNKQVLERLITTQIQLQHASMNGIVVDEETLNSTISNIAAQNDLSLAEFREVLQRDGFKFASFREDIRKEVIIRRLRQRQVDSRITVTAQEIDDFIATQKVQGNINSDYHLGHILVALPDAATPQQIKTSRNKALAILDELNSGADFRQMAIGRSDGRQALQGGDLGWRKTGELPTIFADVAVNMTVGEVSEPIRSASGFHIITLFDFRDSERHMVNQVQARHILIKPQAESADAVDPEQQLNNLRTRIEAGEDFAELAKSFSDDAGSAVNGGDLGWVSPGVMVKPFEAVIFDLKDGEISAPFESQFGWHMAQVLAHREFDNTEEHNNARVRDLIFQRKSEEEHLSWLRKLREEAYVEYRLDD
ncbi:Periplasmic chaperone and peptidyl-prolyl cis-trans isomerase of outer membrane proteins SurA [hydrothermal vent metagenome]|uniref:Periplasmic chaperone and peptidyl-prolyl cis-trans isomerase of outer membrane proteins SurA n=1 Tax=hydrothermal vent metagenome TaxID=652676 RepID=A0A3B0ZG31_9ZZZZ